MRYVLAAILVCAVGMPAASALPTVGPNSLSVLKANSIVQAAKRKAPPSRRRSSGSSSSGSSSGGGSSSGIHPLVGSGDY